MTDEERQARIGELLRSRALVIDLLEATNTRLRALGYEEPTSLLDVKLALERAAVRIAGEKTGAQARWITYLLEGLNSDANAADFQAFLEDARPRPR